MQKTTHLSVPGESFIACLPWHMGLIVSGLFARYYTRHPLAGGMLVIVRPGDGSTPVGHDGHSITAWICLDPYPDSVRS